MAAALVWVLGAGFLLRVLSGPRFDPFGQVAGRVPEVIRGDHGVERAVPLQEAHKKELFSRFVTVVRATVKGNIRMADVIDQAVTDRERPLREDVVGMNRLEIDLAREEEVGVVQIPERLQGRGERDPDGVLDEARLQVGVLDDEELVRPLQQLVDW